VVETTQKAKIRSDSKTVKLETLGCKLNQADTQALTKEFVEAGYRVAFQDDPVDVYVLNTCTVTHVADRKGRQAVRSAKRRNPGSTIVATGCYAERAPNDLRAMPEVDFVVGNSDKVSLVAMLEDGADGPDTACAVGDDRSLEPVLKLRSRAMIKIQEGCDQVCAYCIVPKVRGRERSIPLRQIVATANSYSEAGCQEIVLTGTQLGSYGFDLPDVDITSLVRILLVETDLPRIRISSLQPQDISDELLDLWTDRRLCPHFHVPLQSGSDSVLERMRRRYSSESFLGTVRRIQGAVPDVAVTADVIVGFPGESDSDFRQTVDVCLESELASAHVFPYSIRPGTSAAYFDAQVDAGTKTERAAELTSVARSLSLSFRNRFLGHSREVLWERAVEKTAEGRPVWSGLTDNYIRVRACSKAALTNRIASSRLMSIDGDWVRAEVPDLQS
jgi:threonylcarbamoyladenosine tRNA methylthiotransferase MtaB